MADGFDITPAATAADIAAVVDLCWAYRDFLLQNSAVDRQITETFYPAPKYRQLMADLPQLHARPRGIILLARSAAGTPLGCGMTHALDADTCEIKRVFVTDAGRGQGIASTLCRRLMDQARMDGFARVVLDTSRNLPGAQRLYTALGFTPRGPYQPIPDTVLPELLFFETRL